MQQSPVRTVVQCSRIQSVQSCMRDDLTPQVAKDEYDAFFKQTFKEFLEPLAHSHFNVEGTIEFTAMLFVPGMAPFEQQVWNLPPPSPPRGPPPARLHCCLASRHDLHFRIVVSVVTIATAEHCYEVLLEFVIA